MLSTDFETDKRMETDLVACGELRYTLRVDPKEVHGEDFPGGTVRVLKEMDVRLYGEYRTRRLVLEAWDGQG
jgi:hypothetical protein